MSRFAKIEEAAIKRHTELTGEEMRLYVLIKFHTFADTGICRKNLRQMAAIHGLSYTHTTERYKNLKKYKWCEDTKKGIRPLVEINVPETGTSEDEMFQKPEHSYSENRNIEVPETGTSEDEMFQKPEHLFKGIIEPFKDQNFSNTTAAEKTAAAAADKNGHQSKFSIEECLRYAEICVLRGEPIKNPHGLAMTAYQTGTHDVFIQARLYPDETENTEPAATGEIADYRAEALAFLVNMKAENLDISGMKQFYEDDWAWLMEQLQ